ncbi:MAG: S41 family peptidase [Anaerolineae bacterium]|nr:MAG: S41 family peptidase [Anaerolineae bacterium]
MVMRSQFNKVASLVLLVTLTFGAGYFFRDSQEPAVAQTGTSRDELFAPFWESWDLLHDNYVDPLDEESDLHLMEAALDGMLTSLGDPNMGYMDPETSQMVFSDLSGEFEGIGATVRKDEETGALLIVRPLPGSPAEQAGILPGDEIVTVDGEDITQMEQEVIITLVRGPAGTDVVLGVRREGSEDIIEITVTRARISLPSVEFDILDGDIAYIQLYDFSRDAGSELTETLIEADAQNRAGLILDLRGNTGGYLDVALEVMSQFVESGPIMIERGSGDQEQIYQAFGGALAPTVPMVILVDANSASASEILAATFQDLGRATVVGTQSYGKGTVQTWRQLSNGGAVRITIARWYTPDERSIDLVGVTPDIVVEFEPLEPGTIYSYDVDSQLQAAIKALDGVGLPQVHLPISGGLWRL